MVKVIINDEKSYQCEECGFEYKDDSISGIRPSSAEGLATGKEWAEKCEAWCKEHHTCNLEIIKHAVSPKDSRQL